MRSLARRRHRHCARLFRPASCSLQFADSEWRNSTATPLASRSARKAANKTPQAPPPKRQRPEPARPQTKNSMMSSRSFNTFNAACPMLACWRELDLRQCVLRGGEVRSCATETSQRLPGKIRPMPLRAALTNPSVKRLIALTVVYVLALQALFGAGAQLRVLLTETPGLCTILGFQEPEQPKHAMDACAIHCVGHAAADASALIAAAAMVLLAWSGAANAATLNRRAARPIRAFYGRGPPR